MPRYYDTTVTSAPRKETYCELGEDLPDRVDALDYLEMLAAHHLAAALCGMDGRKISLHLVSREAGGQKGKACHRLGPSHGFMYPKKRATYINVENPRRKRINVILHETRHCWQLQTEHEFDFSTSKAQEADARGFADRYEPKVSRLTEPLLRVLAARIGDAREACPKKVQEALYVGANLLVGAVGLEPVTGRRFSGWTGYRLYT